MGMKDRLEEIRSGNAESYGDPEFRLRGFDAAGRADHPWWSIWSSPRPTIRAVVADDPLRWVVTIALLSGFGRAVTRAAARDYGDKYPLVAILAGCVVMGFAMQILAFSLGGAVLHLVGSWLGSSASGKAVRAALAWSSVPLVAVSAFWALALAFYGKTPLTAAGPDPGAYPESPIVMSFLYTQQIILLLWSVVLGFVCLAEVLRFSLWRVTATLALASLLVFAILIVPVGVAVSWMTSHDGPRSATTTVALLPASRAAAEVDEVARFVEADHQAHKPDPAWGPVVRAIWEEGYKVTAGVDRDRPDRPVIALKIEVATTHRVNDEVLRHLRSLPELRELDLSHAPEVTDDGMANLRDLARLRKLCVFNGGFTDAIFAWLSRLGEMEDLSLMACSRIDGSGLARLAGAPRLRRLRLSDCRVRGEHLAALRGLPALRDLDLSGMSLADADLAPLAGLSLLERLDLGAMNSIRGPGLIDLAGLTKLRELGLVNDPLTDEAVPPLAALMGLKRLDVGGTGLSTEGIARLRRSLPGTKIDGP